MVELKSHDLYLEYLGRDILLDVEAGVERQGCPASSQWLPLFTQLGLHSLYTKMIEH